MLRIPVLSLASLALFCSVICAQTDPAITSWLVNRDGARGQSTDSRIHAIVSQIPANVTRVQYNATDAFVESTGIPSYPIGPWGRNPNTPSNQNFKFRIPRSPQKQNGNNTLTGLGPIGVLVNGVVFFNPTDARSYNNQRIWWEDAIPVIGKNNGWDKALGHPAPRGDYHHHQRPELLLRDLCDNSHRHSPLIGFASDGFPVYGPYGFVNTNGSGGVKRMNSRYRLRNMTTRTSLPNGPPLPPSQHGPPVSSQYPLGIYSQDYIYVKGAGDLDEFNGRVCVTPEYPNGTFAYFATIDAKGDSAFPYFVGMSYYGVFVAENRRGQARIPSGLTLYQGGSISCYGSGCSASKPLALSYSGIAGVGLKLNVDLSNGPASGNGWVALGIKSASTNLSILNMPGCYLYQSLELPVGISFSGGQASLGLAIPNKSNLSGHSFFTQGFALDPSANGCGVTTSNGGKVIVGG